MHPAELAILLHRALEVRMARFLERLQMPAWEADPEGLHQVRVAARRLTAVLDLVDPEAYGGHKGHRRTLKRLVRALGPTRELDVHAETLVAQHLAVLGTLQAATLEHLLVGLNHSRAKTRRTLGKDLAPLKLEDLPRLLKVASLPNPFQAISLQEAAWLTLAPHLTLLGDLQDLRHQEDATALHRARVRTKKLRYALEALEGAFDAPPEAVLAFLRDIQTCLGTHHDLAALEAWLWLEEGRLRGQGHSILCSGVLDLLGVIAENRRAAFEHFTTLLEAKTAVQLISGLRHALGLPLPEDTRS